MTENESELTIYLVINYILRANVTDSVIKMQISTEVPDAILACIFVCLWFTSSPHVQVLMPVATSQRVTWPSTCGHGIHESLSLQNEMSYFIHVSHYYLKGNLRYYIH
jgi:hypothetical protein